jgi:hypothetical protein
VDQERRGKSNGHTGSELSWLSPKKP